MPENNQDLETLEGVLTGFADLIREGSGSSAPILGSDLLQGLTGTALATCYIDGTRLSGIRFVKGSTDVPASSTSLEYFENLMRSYTNKIKYSSYASKMTVNSIYNGLQDGHVSAPQKGEDDKYIVVIPNTITEIGVRINQSSFADAGMLYVPDSVVTINNVAFEYLHVDTIRLPSALTDISYRCFSNSWITNMTLPSTLTSIEERAFESCGRLTRINSDTDGVYNIGTLNEDGLHLGDFVFANGGANNVTTLNLTNISGVDAGFLAEANFINSLTTITANYTAEYTGNQNIMAYSNTLCNLNSEEVIVGCKTSSDSELPSDITRIGAYAFYGVQAPSSKVFGLYDEVESIGAHAFENSNIYLSSGSFNSVTSVGDFAFANNTGIQWVDEGDFGNVYEIGEQAFANSSVLTMGIGDRRHVINRIGYNAFYGCERLLSRSQSDPDETIIIWYNGNPDTIAEDSTFKENVLEGFWCGGSYDYHIHFIPTSTSYSAKTYQLSEIMGGSGSGSGY